MEEKKKLTKLEIKENLKSLWITSLCSSDLKRAQNKNQTQQQKPQRRTAAAQKRYQKDKFTLQLSSQGNCNADWLQGGHDQQPQWQQLEQSFQEPLRQQSTLLNRLRYANKLKYAPAERDTRASSGAGGGLEILETQFVDSIVDNKMDDMIFHYNNENSIYVLNSNYNSYGEFARLNLIEPLGVQLGPINADDKATNCQQHALTAKSSSNNNNSSRSCSTAARSLQHKLKTLGNFNDINGATEAIGSPAVSSTSSAACLPAAAALHKLFNCSSVANNMSSSCSNIPNSSSSSNNNNSTRYNRARDCLSATTEHTSGVLGTGALLSAGGVGNGNKKKCSNVKSTLIAKKTKFWKFLEEEKWRAHEADSENSAINNCERRNSDTINAQATATLPAACHANSCVKKSTASSSQMSTATTTASCTTLPACEPLFSHKKPYNSNKTATSTEQQPQLNKSKNWSGSHDSNNQQQQQPQQQQQQQKSSHELYKEAAELLGLSCTLCDNCRCLDCQSGYFDCDDSDSYSEFSYMDEYDEDVVSTATSAMQLMMHATDYYDDMPTSYCGQQQQQQQQQHQQRQQQLQPQQQHDQHTCTDANCNMSDSDDCEPALSNSSLAMHICQLSESGNQISAVMSPSNEGDQVGNLIVAVGKEHAQQSRRGSLPCNELENCASFNELSLVDAKAQP